MQDGKKSSMTQKKIDALNAVGFVWVARSIDYKSDSDNEEEPKVKSEQVSPKATAKTEDIDEDGGDQSGGDGVTSCEDDKKKDSSDSKGDSPAPPMMSV
jgi:hypothetical protein